MARDFTFRFASLDTVGGAVARVGPAVINDRKERSQHELDVVATSWKPTGAAEVIAIGEAKATTRRRSLGDLTRLETVRSLLVDRELCLPSTKLLLFSVNGFDPNLQLVAGAPADVELIDLDRMYNGA